MDESQIGGKVAWQVEDLLDLDYLLQLDSKADQASLVLRDEKIAQQNLLPILGEAGLLADAAPELRSQGFAIWLQQRRELRKKNHKSELGLMPGEVFSQVRRLVMWAGAGAMLAAGIVLIFSLLHREERYFNVMMFLAATLLPQLLLLGVLLLGWAWRGVAGNKKTAQGVAQVLLATAIAWLLGKIWAHDNGEQWREQWQSLKQKRYLMWQVLSLSQLLAVFYNVGILLGFGLCLAGMELRFFWESTPVLAAVEAIEQVVRWVSAPWSGMLPHYVPSVEGIAATRITIEGAAEVFPSSKAAESAKVWAAFLAAAVFFWGLLPRIFLWLAVDFWGRRSARTCDFVERHHRELWRRLTTVEVATSNEGADDDAVVLLWGGLKPDPEALRKTLLQQLRLNPLQTFTAGDETDSSLDADKISRVASEVSCMAKGCRLVVVLESWALAPREATDFLNELRIGIGEQRAVRLLLLGPPKEGCDFTAPSGDEIKAWQQLVAARNDVAMTVYPYRAD